MSDLIFTKATMGTDEEVLFSAEAHWARFIKPVLGMIGAVVVLILGFLLEDNYILIVGGVFFVPAFFCWVGQMQIEIVATNKRVIYKRGAYWFITQELRLSKIESVYIWQPIAAGLLGCGTIYFSGTGGMRLAFKYVKDPAFAKARFEDVIDEYSR